MKHQPQLRMKEEFDLFEVDGSENEDMGENSEGMQQCSFLVPVKYKIFATQCRKVGKEGVWIFLRRQYGG